MSIRLRDLVDAAGLIRQRARDATSVEGERWMADSSPDYGLVVGSYAPGDVAEDGTISTACLAYLAYPDDPDRRTHAHGVPAAAHVAAFDPPVALAIAAWLEAEHAHFARVWQGPHVPERLARAVEVARVYLRSEVSGV